MITQEGSNCKLVRSVRSGNGRCFLGQLLKQISFKGRKSRVKGNQDWKNTAEPKTCRSKDQSTATSVSPPREVIRQGMGGAQPPKSPCATLLDSGNHRKKMASDLLLCSKSHARHLWVMQVYPFNETQEIGKEKIGNRCHVPNRLHCPMWYPLATHGC